jgi:hypothetical protein
MLVILTNNIVDHIEYTLGRISLCSDTIERSEPELAHADCIIACEQVKTKEVCN